jgi:hypothetical protein
MVAELLRDRPGRGVSSTTCVLLFALFVATIVAAAAFAFAHWGGARRWPLVYRAAVVLVCIGGSFSWWWINGSVEGHSLAVLSQTHGLTTGDLLVAPALLLAAALVVTTAWPRVRALLDLRSRSHVV